ncbi:MAG: putative hydrolase or acyltransferase of alpha/beta superfamily [Actinomycetia bacterium]|nr:putative hydrolase or acyltransferase of alpha/beta superfamily [Actinomycetes bacterium]
MVIRTAYARNARDAVRVRFEDDGGGGAPVVILGGFLDPIELVRRAPIAQALARFTDEFRLIYVDHRGHGKSDKPHDAAAYGMALRVADVVAVLDKLQIRRADLLGISWGGRLCFGVGRHAPERVRSLIAIGQHPYEIDRDGPLARVVGDALEASKQRGIEALVEAFEAIAGRYPDGVRSTYLSCDAEAMRAAWEAATAEGAVAEDLGTWSLRCLICAAEDDADFFEDARRAAEEIPNAEFVAIPGTDHLGVDTARVDPVLPAVLRTLRDAN